MENNKVILMRLFPEIGRADEQYGEKEDEEKEWYWSRRVQESWKKDRVDEKHEK